MVTEKEKDEFRHCAVSMMTRTHTRDSIGKLGEKTVHAVVKDYLSPDKAHQEVRLGRYVADIFDGNQVIEIQTANWGLLRSKVSAFLKDYPVTLVLPLPHKKKLVWISPETGEVVKKHASPVTGSIYEAFREFYRIKPLLLQDLAEKRQLTLRVLLIDVEEYRLLDGWSADKKRGSHRYDRNPTALFDDISLCTLDDYKALIPADLSEPFTVKDLAKALHVRGTRMGVCVNVLNAVGAIKRTDNIGRAYAYIRQ